MKRIALGYRAADSRHNATKTHCPKGHPYDESNTYWRPPTAKRPYSCRICRTCQYSISEERRRSRQRFITAVKTTAGCIDCGTCEGKLDFDHRPGTKKDFRLALCGGKSWPRIVAEMEKCDVRCGSCHLLRHWNDGTRRRKQVRS